MAKIEFPKLLKALLEESDLQAPIRSLADRIGEILTDNKMPFFPDYTDHGIAHIHDVLKAEVDLVPKSIWEGSKKDSDHHLLCDADAAVIVGATLLHDIAMHLCPDGFRELVSKDSKFLPLPWFKESHEGHSSDIPWHVLWDNYQREARRFSDRQLTNIIGEESAKVWKFQDLPAETGQWDRNHHLIIGEFIRRHHARLAHEIAIYGFPGLPVGSAEGKFPAMGKEEGHTLMRLADLIGLTARSHGTSLRVCKAYLEAHYPGTPRPMGTAVLYPMALLRVADYLQIDRQRAPAVLLQLRNPQSPISVQEWKKHRAVQQIGPANDPRGKMVTVSTELSLSLYLQLKDLLAGLQAEMDHSTAVLDEAYGTMTELGLNQLNLGTRRVYSNLQSPAFRDSLPYVPNRTGFTADPNLLTLLVEPLYGKHPNVGVRELMQNAADAVRELEAWCETHNISINSLDLPEQDGDVLIEFIKRENGTWFLRVRDRGIGMLSDTIQNYFLRAGASFRRSAEWAKEFLDENGQPRVLRAGRFGIGAFAVFLLGPSFKLWTRHAGADKSMGYTIEASASSQLIEIRRVDGLPVGTTIEAELSTESVKSLYLESDAESLGRKVDWFCWDWPKVTKRMIRGPKPEDLKQEFAVPVRKGDLPPEWSVIHPRGFDAVYWTFGQNWKLSCNGLVVAEPSLYLHAAGFAWPKHVQLRCPSIAVLDSAANLPLTTQRYQLSQNTVPFVDELARDVTLSFIAHALVCGPSSPDEALLQSRLHPLMQRVFQYEEDELRSPIEGRLRWCVTSTRMVPSDPWLYKLLDTNSCLLYGEFSLKRESLSDHLVQANILKRAGEAGIAMLPWHVRVRSYGDSEPPEQDELRRGVLGRVACYGVKCLGSATATNVLVSTSSQFEFRPKRRKSHPMPVYQYNDENPAGSLWKKVPRQSSQANWFKAETGTLKSAVSLEQILEAWEAALRDEREKWEAAVQAKPKNLRDELQVPGNPERAEFRFIAEVCTTGSNSPDTMIAKIWNECLGAKAIPFDPDARKDLIAEGSKHPELKRHLDAWSEMKRKKSQ